MQMKTRAASWIIAGAIGVAGILTGCSETATQTDTGNSAAAIDFEAGPALGVKQGSFLEVVLSLQNSSGVVSQKVRLVSSDTAVSDVTPASCTLSSSSDASSKCTVKVHGKANGTARLTVHADDNPNTAVAGVTPTSYISSSLSDATSKGTVKVDGKANGTVRLTMQADRNPNVSLTAAAQADGGSVVTELAITVSDALTYGTLKVSDDSGAFVATTPLAVSFNGTGTGPYQKTLTAEISGSSGIVSGTGALINFSSAVAGVSFNPAQCAVTSAAPQCPTTVSLPATTTSPIPILVEVVGAVTALTPAPGYSPITVNATASTIPTYGAIALSTQSGNHVPNGMKAPLFVNWTNTSVNDTVTVVLSIAGTGASFYSYPAGDNIGITTTTTQTCTLTNTGVTATSVFNCGLGLVGTATSGTVTVNATATATSGNKYTIAPLTLGTVAPEPTRRAITFTNNSTSTIFVGITGGASSSYLNAKTPAVAPGTITANLKPGAGSWCGPSNPQAACSIGTTCLQGGASPSKNIADTPFFCYYDQTAPTKGYKLDAPGAAPSTTVLEISGSSLSPGGIIWSGNFYARTGCDPTTGVCENATCVGAAKGLVCGPGTGATPGTNTLAELTFQAYPAPDFYDVSIINGVNFAVQFGPTNVAVSTTDAYSCGTAGSLTAQNGGYPGGATPSAGLPAATWAMTPTTAASFPLSVTTTGDAASYYRAVIPSTVPVTPCTVSSPTCKTAPDTTCGYAMTDVVKGGFNFATRTCGKPVAWLTADAIWGFNQSAASNLAPFAFTKNWANGLTGAGAGTVSVGDLQLCINSTYSSYVNNGTTTSSTVFPIQPLPLACGGVMWGATETPLQNPAGNVGLNLTRPSQLVQTANVNWLDNVLPTIKWLKRACPTCYTYPFDDMSSTFTCANTTRSVSPITDYSVIFSDLK